MRTHNNRAAPINNCANICTYCAIPLPLPLLLQVARVLAAGNCRRQQQLAIAKKLHAMQLTAAAAAAPRDTTVPGPQHQITMHPPPPSPSQLPNFICSLLPVMASTSAAFLVAALSYGYGYGYGSRALGYGSGTETLSQSQSQSCAAAAAAPVAT